MFLPPPGKSEDERFSEKPMPSAAPASASPHVEHKEGDPIPDNVPQGDDLYAHVLHCMEEGSSKKDIRTQLIAFGYSGADSDRVIEEVAEWRRTHGQTASHAANGGRSGNANMWMGGIICLIGTVVTIGSCLAASSGNGGGSYVVAWGAIIFGFLQFVRGIQQSNNEAQLANDVQSEQNDLRPRKKNRR